MQFPDNVATRLTQKIIFECFSEDNNGVIVPLNVTAKNRIFYAIYEILSKELLIDGKIKCPDCNGSMTKSFIECDDQNGFFCAWLCDCHNKFNRKERRRIKAEIKNNKE